MSKITTIEAAFKALRIKIAFKMTIKRQLITEKDFKEANS